MCVVSLVTEHYRDKWWPSNPWNEPRTTPWITQPEPEPQAPIDWEKIREKFKQAQQELKPPTQEEIKEFRELLERAREYDKRNNQPDCELDVKKRVLKEIAESWGIDISFIDKEE